jgi:hypothetical protein
MRTTIWSSGYGCLIGVRSGEIVIWTFKAHSRAMIQPMPVPPKKTLNTAINTWVTLPDRKNRWKQVDCKRERQHQEMSRSEQVIEHSSPLQRLQVRGSDFLVQRSF